MAIEVPYAKLTAPRDANFLKLDLWCYDPGVDQAVNLLVEEFRDTSSNTFKRFDRGIYFRAMKLLALNLYYSYTLQENEPLIISLNSSFYSGDYLNPANVTYTGISRLVEWMKGTLPPFIHLDKGDYYSKRRTRIRDTGLMTTRLSNYLHPGLLTVNRKTELVRMFGPKRDGRYRIDHGNKRNAQRMERFLVRLNSFMGKACITVGQTILSPYAKFQYRVFNNSRWNQGGRFYGGIWKSIKKELRQSITINGSPCTELDYDSLHASMAYAEEGLPQPEYDPYSIPELTVSSELRSFLKFVFMAALNSEARQDAIGAVQRELVETQRRLVASGRATYDPSINYRQDAEYIYDGVIRNNPDIANLFGSGIGIKLQTRDSEIARRVMSILMNEGIVCLGVHDSFIVPTHDKERLRNVMTEAYQAEMGDFEIRISEKWSCNIVPWAEECGIVSS